MIRYNITIRERRQPPPEGPFPPVGIAGERMVRRQERPKARIASRLTSLVLHMAALAGVVALTHRATLSPPPAEPAIAVVFRAPDGPPRSEPPPPPAEPSAETTPQPPVPELPEPAPPPMDAQPLVQPSTSPPEPMPL